MFTKLVNCTFATNILGFHLNFSTSWTSFVKEQWPKKSLFWHFWLYVIIFESMPKWGWINLRSLKSYLMTNSTRDTQIWICFFVVGEQFRSLSSNQSKLNFWNQLHTKIALLCRSWTQTATWRPNHTILTSSLLAILKAMINTVVWDRV